MYTNLDFPFFLIFDFEMILINLLEKMGIILIRSFLF